MNSTNRNPEKVYLKDKNMTLKEFQDIEYSILMKIGVKMVKNLNKITDFKTLVEPNNFNIILNNNRLN